MSRTSRLPPKRACTLACQCLVLLATLGNLPLGNLPASRADERKTQPSASQRDAAQPDLPDLPDIPVFALAPGAASTLPDSNIYGDTWINDTLPRPSDLPVVGSLSGTRTINRISQPTTSQRDLPQPDLLDVPLFARPLGVDSTLPDSPGYRDTWINDTPPRPADLLVAGSHNGDGDLEVTSDTAPRGYADGALRAGWWAVARQGSVTKVGEYQDLKSSPFWDIDLLRSDGYHTLDLFGTGLDRESTQAGLYYFTPAYTAELRYQRFLHRLDHDPLLNIPPRGSGAEIVKEDLNVGDDYAIRVQDIRTDLSGKLTDNVKYQLDVWFRRKKGERQALGTHHGMPAEGFFCRKCHVLSQRQEIDWLSTRVEPSIEARIGSITAEYSRPMRFFGQNDALVTRSYGSVHPYENYAVDYLYAVVPESVSQTDRLKLSSDLPLQSQVYSQLYRGDTRNQNRDTRRDFYGFDVRLSNTYFSRTTLDGFVRYNRQLNQLPPFLVPPEDVTLFVPTATVPAYGFRNPIDYLRTSTGVNANVRPFRTDGLANRLTVNVGAEIGSISRSYAEYQVQNPPAFVDQARTSFLTYFAGTSMRWHPRFDTRLRYEHRNASNPLYGVNAYWGLTNTNQPTSEDIVSLDATWIPADNLMASANVALENRQNQTGVANFTEDDYPMTFTLWYAPRPAWSISGGYGYYTNWIDQDIYFPSDTPEVTPLDRQQWNYGGRGQVLSFGGDYACTDRLTLSGSLQFVWALNTFDPLASWPDLPANSEVLVNARRYVSGIDWSASQWVSAYMRYIYEDYEDGSAPYNSGSVHMFLAGLTATR